MYNIYNLNYIQIIHSLVLQILMDKQLNIHFHYYLYRNSNTDIKHLNKHQHIVL